MNAAPHEPPRAWWLHALGALGPVLMLALLLLLLGPVMGSRFYNQQNIGNMLTHATTVGTAALGMTLIIIIGGIDLGVGSALALCAACGTLALNHGDSTVLAVLASMGAGVVVGLANAGLIVAMRVPAFIATLGMLLAVRGIAQWSIERRYCSAEPSALDPLMKVGDGWLPVAPGTWVMFALAVMLSVLLNRTVLGRRIYAVGSNPVAARACGISVPAITTLVYVLAGAIVGIAGVMAMRFNGGADPSMNEGDELQVIAAVVIGGASLNGGRGTVLGTLVGSIIMVVLNTALTQANWDVDTRKIVTGAVIVAAVSVDQTRQSALVRGWVRRMFHRRSQGDSA